MSYFDHGAVQSDTGKDTTRKGIAIDRARFVGGKRHVAFEISSFGPSGDRHACSEPHVATGDKMLDSLIGVQQEDTVDRTSADLSPASQAADA